MTQTQLAISISKKLIELSKNEKIRKEVAKNDSGCDPNLIMLMATLPEAIAYGIVTYVNSLHPEQQ